MSGDVTYWIELVVGLGCMSASIGASRSGPRWLGVVLGVAGVAATFHAIAALA
jgi:hypothetical protein